MSRLLRYTLYAVLPVLLWCCAPVLSLAPLYTQETIVSMPQLLGKWKYTEGGGYWKFEETAEKYYKLITNTDGGSGEFEAYVVKLGNKNYLDIYPIGHKEKENSGFFKKKKIDFIYSFHIMPVHSIHQLTILNDSLHLSYMEEDVFKKRKPEASMDVKEWPTVSTLSTENMQKYIIENEADPSLFDNWVSLTR